MKYLKCKNLQVNLFFSTTVLNSFPRGIFCHTFSTQKINWAITTGKVIPPSTEMVREVSAGVYMVKFVQSCLIGGKQGFLFLIFPGRPLTGRERLTIWERWTKLDPISQAHYRQLDSAPQIPSLGPDRLPFQLREELRTWTLGLNFFTSSGFS